MVGDYFIREIVWGTKKLLLGKIFCVVIFIEESLRAFSFFYGYNRACLGKLFTKRPLTL